MNLVVNEWLLEYFPPGTSRENWERVQSFFDRIEKLDRMMVIGRETPFTRKFYRYMKIHGHNRVFKENCTRLNDLLFKNPQRTILVEPSQTRSVADEEAKGVHADDRYLLDLVRTIPDSVIVSTDERLIKALEGTTTFPIVHLKDYLEARPNSDALVERS